MMNSKIQTGLRIPEERYEELSEMANKIGVSINALSLVLIDVGLSAIRLGTPEALHSLLRNQQDIGE